MLHDPLQKSHQILQLILTALVVSTQKYPGELDQDEVWGGYQLDLAGVDGPYNDQGGS